MNIKSTWLSTLFLTTAYASVLSPCEFPARWRGAWFQSGVGRVEITSRDFMGKGHCVRALGDFHVVNNSVDGCLTCVLVVDRHENILQYKEGFCVKAVSSTNVCNYMSVDAYLYTLIAADSPVPSPCPFHHDYSVLYSDNEHGFCHEASSSLIRVQEMYYLELRHCQRHAIWNNEDFVMQCLGDWTEGSQQLLVFKLITASGRAKTYHYHCGKYQIDDESKDGYISISGDSNCWNVISPHEGPVVMQLTEVKRSDPQPEVTCAFPPWTEGGKWTEVHAGRVSMAFSRGQVTMTTSNFNSSMGGDTPSELTCQHLQNFTDSSFILRATQNDLSSANSDPGLCIHGDLVAPGILALAFIPAGSDGHKSRKCHRRVKASHVVVFRKQGPVPPASPCPLHGVYVFSQPRLAHTDVCYTLLHMGCDDRTSAYLSTVCNDQVTELNLTCTLSWVDGDYTFVLMNNSKTGKLNYMSYSPSATPGHYRIHLYSHEQWWSVNGTGNKHSAPADAMIRTNSCPDVSTGRTIPSTADSPRLSTTQHTYNVHIQSTTTHPQSEQGIHSEPVDNSDNTIHFSVHDFGNGSAPTMYSFNVILFVQFGRWFYNQHLNVT